MGPATLCFAPRVDADSLRLELVGFCFLGISLPRWFCPQVCAREWAHSAAGGARLQFDIEARLPLVGRVTRHRGYLDIPS